ncbi:MAG: DUF2807 domain-containing protein [Flavobacteriaceae bacterium]|nr:DUF2807 domain-containing protein [Flavobacteriaceae bacterium]
MRKIIAISFVLLVSTCMQAQFFNKNSKGNKHEIKTTRNTSDYNDISVLGSFDVLLVKGTEGTLKIQIEENLLPYLITEVSRGKLSIRWKKNSNIHSRKRVKIKIPIQSIENISLIGSGNISTDEILKEDTLNISITGSGAIKLTVETSLTKVKITGSGNIQLEGNSRQLKCTLAGSGDFSGGNFKCENVHVSVVGSGDASVFVSQQLNASIAGSGELTYYGHPTMEKINVVGSGEVRMQ